MKMKRQVCQVGLHPASYLLQLNLNSQAALLTFILPPLYKSTFQDIPSTMPFLLGSGWDEVEAELQSVETFINKASSSCHD